MAFVVAHVEKYSSGACAGLGIHVDRKTEEHSNKNIDNTLSSENVELVEKYNNNLYGAVKDRIREGYTGKKAIRKDAVATVGVVCSASSDFFENKSKAENVQYFKDCKEFFENKVGKENIVCSKIHFDESTPHMHLYFVPLTDDGRLSAKEVCNREFLRDIQRELPRYLQEKGHCVERGLEDSTNEHISKKEYENNLLKEKLEELEKASENFMEQQRYLEEQRISLEIQERNIRELQEELEKERKKIKELKEKLNYENEKYYALDDIVSNTIENKKIFSSKSTVKLDKELYNSLLKYATEGEKVVQKFNSYEDKLSKYELELKNSKKIFDEKNRDILGKISRLEKEKSELQNEVTRLRNVVSQKNNEISKLEKLEKWLPNEVKEKFAEHQKRILISKNRGIGR